MTCTVGSQGTVLALRRSRRITAQATVATVSLEVYDERGGGVFVPWRTGDGIEFVVLIGHLPCSRLTMPLNNCTGEPCCPMVRPNNVLVPETSRALVGEWRKQAVVPYQVVPWRTNLGGRKSHGMVTSCLNLELEAGARIHHSSCIR